MAAKKNASRTPAQKAAAQAGALTPLRRAVEAQVRLKGEETAGRAQALDALRQMRELFAAGKLPPARLLEQSKQGQAAAERARAASAAWQRAGNVMGLLLASGAPDAKTGDALAALEKFASRWEAAVSGAKGSAQNYAQQMDELEKLGAALAARAGSWPPGSQPQGGAMDESRRRLAEGIVRLRAGPASQTRALARMATAAKPAPKARKATLGRRKAR